jgi:peptidoglycan-N-acetylglucosamine deacetylase
LPTGGEEHRVALTFDDGPHPKWTREILRVLEARAVKATFFVWGERALEHASVIDDVLGAGHSVQPHCWQHRAHPDLSAAQISADIDRVVALLARLGVAGPHLWRPPWGRLLQGETRHIARGRGLELAGWTIDSRDWIGSPGGEMYPIVKERIAEFGGRDAVVLMHDSYLEPRQAAHRSDCGGTVELVRRLIDDEQLTFAPLARGLLDNLEEQSASRKPP